MSLFTEKLKRLRGKMSVEELSHTAGVAPSSIYKAEHTGLVKWETIRRIYGGFFKDDDDRLETLVLWAMDYTRERFAQTSATEMARGLVRDDAELAAETTAELATLLAGLVAQDRELLMQFARGFAQSDTTRDVARGWVSVLVAKGEI